MTISKPCPVCGDQHENLIPHFINVHGGLAAVESIIGRKLDPGEIMSPKSQAVIDRRKRGKR